MATTGGHYAPQSTTGGGTDDQQVDRFALVGTDLVLEVEDGGGQKVADLAPLASGGETFTDMFGDPIPSTP